MSHTHNMHHQRSLLFDVFLNFADLLPRLCTQNDNTVAERHIGGYLGLLDAFHLAS